MSLRAERSNQMDYDPAGDVEALRNLKMDQDPRTISEMIEADEFTDVTVVKATPGDDGWTFIDWKDGDYGGTISCGIRAAAKAGDTVRLYGSSLLGGSHHGAAVNGELAYWRTPWERFSERVKWLADYDRSKREDFERSKDVLDERVEALPAPLKARIERFRREDPKFRVDSEAYEMAAVGDAPKIARALAAEQGWQLDENLRATAPEPQIEAAVKAFHAADYAEQKRRVPDLDEGHSGNTFGAAVSIAYRVLAGLDV